MLPVLRSGLQNVSNIDHLSHCAAEARLQVTSASGCWSGCAASNALSSKHAALQATAYFAS